jgi:hypothetical protein
MARRHRALGQVRLVQERFEEIVANLQAANAVEVTSGTYILLTRAYYELHRYTPLSADLETDNLAEWHVPRNTTKSGS